jgi:1-acyl-sn-glycerol-3-phosphate acyltransferase
MLRALYTAYSAAIFCLLFIVFFFPLLIPIFFPGQFKITGVVNRWWAILFFTLSFIPFSVHCRARLHPRKQYIFCPNHFSYLDIPALGLNPHPCVFVGKNDMENIPLFGYMYRKLHITVNRLSLRSRVNTLLQSMQAIDEGKSLVIFPEGGMVTQNPPHMARFKDGAFRLAIEKQIAIVPVTLPFNWIILPDRLPLRLRWGKLKVIFHEPIETRGLALHDLDKLKEMVFNIIDHELRQHGGG